MAYKVKGKTEKVSPPEVKAEVKETIKPLKVEGKRKVKVTPEELVRLQEEKRLIGYDPLTCEAIIKGDDR